MSVVEWPVAAAEPRCAGDRPLNVFSGTVDSFRDAETLGEAGCDRRGKGAAGAVRVAGRDPPGFPDPDLASGDENIRYGFPGEMAALDQRRSAAEAEQGLAGMLGEFEKTRDPSTLTAMALIFDVEEPLERVWLGTLVRRRPGCGRICSICGRSRTMSGTR